MSENVLANNLITNVPFPISCNFTHHSSIQPFHLFGERINRKQTIKIKFAIKSPPFPEVLPKSRAMSYVPWSCTALLRCCYPGRWCSAHGHNRRWTDSGRIPGLHGPPRTLCTCRFLLHSKVVRPESPHPSESCTIHPGRRCFHPTPR